ncbi:hypothetical protein CEB3_c29970 [Peptococcaceae bacterium CEB3]|nr:hypothetical protein CEB3_c29970 [Peptococcaceae bacterium CEB3]
MSGTVPALIVIILGWLVLNWLPGYLHAKHFDRLNPWMQEIIKRYKYK